MFFLFTAKKSHKTKTCYKERQIFFSLTCSKIFIHREQFEYKRRIRMHCIISCKKSDMFGCRMFKRNKEEKLYDLSQELFSQTIAVNFMLVLRRSERKWKVILEKCDTNVSFFSFQHRFLSWELKTTTYFTLCYEIMKYLVSSVENLNKKMKILAYLWICCWCSYESRRLSFWQAVRCNVQIYFVCWAMRGRLKCHETLSQTHEMTFFTETLNFLK